MSESEKNVFAEIFGEMKAKKPSEQAPSEPAEKAPADPAPAETKEEKVEETPAETPSEAPAEAPAEKEEGDEGVDQKLIDEAKRELGIGGAAFCDELLAGTPDAFSRLKAAGKTLHGFYNFSYSCAMDEYVKANGRVNGGGYWNLSALLEKYLDPSVEEGFTVKEPKAKKPVLPKPVESPAKAVEKVAKKAAKAAKKEKSAKAAKAAKAEEAPAKGDEGGKKEEGKGHVSFTTSDPKSMVFGIDFSRIKFS